MSKQHQDSSVSRAGHTKERMNLDLKPVAVGKPTTMTLLSKNVEERTPEPHHVILVGLNENSGEKLPGPAGNIRSRALLSENEILEEPHTGTVEPSTLVRPSPRSGINLAHQQNLSAGKANASEIAADVSQDAS